ncbi:MAG: transcriptional repressor LexA [Spirochaetales bacterium]
MRELTNRQQQILHFITVFFEENACPPTVRETAEHFSISIKAVQDHFSALRKKGYLAPAEGRSRSLKLLLSEEGFKMQKNCMIPLLGNVAAGKPIFCDENHSETVCVPAAMVKDGGEYFALYVHGDSMTNAGILDGDLAVIRRQNTAENNVIVVALIEESVTLKRFFRESSRIRLQPENDNYKPIYCQNVHILGILSNIIRTY